MLRNGWLVLGWLWVAIVSYLSLMSNPPEPVSFDGVDNLEHALAYTLLMLWFCQIVVARRARILLFIAFVAMGVAIEILQGFGGYRYFEYADMLANTTGVLIGFGLAHTRMGCILMKLERNAKNT
ncbi:MAG: VanZ family protein [Sideroxydans sp.]